MHSLGGLKDFTVVEEDTTEEAEEEAVEKVLEPTSSPKKKSPVQKITLVVRVSLKQ